MLKKRIYEIINKAEKGDKASAIFDYTIIVLIVLNVISVIIASYNNLPQELRYFLNIFELYSVIIFTVEYGLRIWTANLQFPESRHPYIRFVFSFMALIDLFAILPFYLPAIFPVDLRFLRILRLFRIIRLLKINRYNNSINVIIKVLKKEKEKLIMTVFATLILIIFASVIMYYAENESQPEQFPNMVAAIWWSIATITSVWLGDVYPITVLGRIFASVISVLGVGLIALPTGIIGSGFIEEMINKKEKKVCKHCGKEID